MTSGTARAGALSGRAVLITRPRHQSGTLADLIRRSGGEPIVFPTLEIEPVDPRPPMQAILERLSEFDMAVFVSANAVQHAMPLIRAVGGWPQSLRAAAVGQGTARELRAQGVADVLLPGRRSGQRGTAGASGAAGRGRTAHRHFSRSGGRELLAETLRSRGAEVVYVECYRRPQANVGPGAAARSGRAWRAGRRSLGQCGVVAKSARHRGQRHRAANSTTLPLFVIHPNIAESARTLGFSTVIVTETSDQGVVSGIIALLNPPA